MESSQQVSYLLLTHFGWWKESHRVNYFLFPIQVDEFDPVKTLTDSFFFYDATNIQKAGKILCENIDEQCVSNGENLFWCCFYWSFKNWCNNSMFNIFMFYWIFVLFWKPAGYITHLVVEQIMLPITKLWPK